MNVRAFSLSPLANSPVNSLCLPPRPPIGNPLPHPPIGNPLPHPPVGCFPRPPIHPPIVANPFPHPPIGNPVPDPPFKFDAPLTAAPWRPPLGNPLPDVLHIADRLTMLKG